MSEIARGALEPSPVTEYELPFGTDEQKQTWNSALIRTQLANPWLDWEVEPDPGAVLLAAARDELGITARPEDYQEVHRLAHEIATYDGADEYQEDEGDR